MKYYAFVNSEGHTLYVTAGTDAMGLQHGEIYDGNLCLEVDKQISIVNPSYYIDDVYYDYETAKWETKPPCPSVEYYQWKNKQWVFISELFMSRLRWERDRILASCDWTQMPDSPLTSEQKTNWSTYRQALRDFPATITTQTTLEELVWPTQP